MFGPQCVKSAGADRTMSASEVRDGMSSVFGQVRSAPKDPFFVRGQGTIYFNRHGWLFGEGRRLGVDEMTAFKPNLLQEMLTRGKHTKATPSTSPK